MAVAHQAQRSRQNIDLVEGAPPGPAARLRRASALPRHTAGSLWDVDLAEPDIHLREALDRALASLPPSRPASEAPSSAPGAGSTLSRWGAGHKAVFDEATERLAEVWPQMLAELRVGVRQIALLQGAAIHGFTDFTVHGAVFVNSARLHSRPGGLPGWVRLAEALVHEGTHTRCNAAALVTAFLAPAADTVTPVSTPLRADPRPLSGLFQQTVVLVRLVLLYRRLLESCRNRGTADAALLRALELRRGKLATGAHQGIGTVGQHAGALTQDGRAVLAQARDLLEEEDRHPALVAPPTSASETSAASGRGL
ncbi:aKG-HExxH-type peptide beta-hydroxylase [Streptomyces sp. NPDC048387]|uniref:aKG-HExxH-type peptide beta-hydroxylase n=1 Tax=Streptomyces sp. NPDC048387 TaxID=3365542 RepID=UPI00371A8306